MTELSSFQIVSELMSKGTELLDEDIMCAKVTLNTELSKEKISQNDINKAIAIYDEKYPWYSFEFILNDKDEVYIIIITRKE